MDNLIDRANYLAYTGFTVANILTPPYTNWRQDRHKFANLWHPAADIRNPRQTPWLPLMPGANICPAITPARIANFISKRSHRAAVTVQTIYELCNENLLMAQMVDFVFSQIEGFSISLDEMCSDPTPYPCVRRYRILLVPSDILDDKYLARAFFKEKFFYIATYLVFSKENFFTDKDIEYSNFQGLGFMPAEINKLYNMNQTFCKGIEKLKRFTAYTFKKGELKPDEQQDLQLLSNDIADSYNELGYMLNVDSMHPYQSPIWTVIKAAVPSLIFPFATNIAINNLRIFTEDQIKLIFQMLYFLCVNIHPLFNEIFTDKTRVSLVNLERLYLPRSGDFSPRHFFAMLDYLAYINRYFPATVIDYFYSDVISEISKAMAIAKQQGPFKHSFYNPHYVGHAQTATRRVDYYDYLYRRNLIENVALAKKELQECVDIGFTVEGKANLLLARFEFKLNNLKSAAKHYGLAYESMAKKFFLAEDYENMSKLPIKSKIRHALKK